MSIQGVFTHGNLVDVNVSMWRGERKLKPEDLGLDKTTISDAFTLGHKRLVPREVMGKFVTKEGRARAILMHYSFPFSFGAARFVPKKAFADFVGEMDPLIKEFDALADQFCAEYETHKEAMKTEYIQAAHEAYDRARLLCGFSVDKETFTQEFLARVDSFYPPASEIRKRFHLEYLVFRAELPDLSQASYGDLMEEHEKVQLMQQAYQKSLERKVHEFVDSVISDMRTKASTVLERFSSGLKGKIHVSEATINSVRDLVDDYGKKDIVGDTKFYGMLTTFRKKLDMYSAKVLREDDRVRKAMYDELKILIALALDKTEMQALAEGYRKANSL